MDSDGSNLEAFEKWLVERGDGIELTGLKHDELLTCWLAALEFARKEKGL